MSGKNKKIKVSGVIFAGILGISGLLSILGHSPLCAGEGQMLYSREFEKALESGHKGVGLPIRMMMIQIKNRADNILDGILEGNYKYVKQEADAVAEVGTKIINTYFPHSLDIEAWAENPETSHLEPETLEKFKELRDDFRSYFRRVESAVQEIKKAADTYDEEATFSAFGEMIKKTCFECHRRYRD